VHWGGTAFNSIVKEWSEKTTGKADLREMPHYLLWRLKQEQKSDVEKKGFPCSFSTLSTFLENKRKKRG
jgi:hypothetical protein